MTTWKTLAMDFTTAYDANTLQGLPGVHVAVHLDVDDAFQQVAEDPDGLTMETLRGDVELQLRLAGIRRLTEDELGVTPSRPVLTITIGIVETGGALSGVHGFALTVGLYQAAALAAGVETSAETWNMGHVGFAASERVGTLVRDQVREKTRSFVDAWLSVNQV
jgi:hypothetical protein